MHQHHDPDDSSPLGVEAIKEFVREFRRAFSDLTDTIHIQLAEGDLVSIAFTSTGTSDGPLHNIQPTGKRVTWTGMVIDRVRDGRIVESSGNWDQLGMLQQHVKAWWNVANWADAAARFDRARTRTAGLIDQP
jgi:predicted ester cyclase